VTIRGFPFHNGQWDFKLGGEWYPAKERRAAVIVDTLQRLATAILTNGMYASAFTGLLVFTLGMIIVHFTPDDDRDRKGSV
jgi:hypothetical protein